MSLFDWERDENEQHEEAAAEIARLRREAFRTQIQLIVGAYHQDPINAHDEWHDAVYPRIWDIAMCVAMDVTNFDDLSDEEIDGLNPVDN